MMLAVSHMLISHLKMEAVEGRQNSHVHVLLVCDNDVGSTTFDTELKCLLLKQVVVTCSPSHHGTYHSAAGRHYPTACERSCMGRC
jgi:hypothetical protein